MNINFENAVENGEGGNLPSEEIIYCKDCINFYNIHLCLLDKHGAIGEKAEVFRY